MGMYTDILSDEDEEPGVHAFTLSNAVSTWSFMQNRQTSVAEAATTFNTTPDLIRAAIDDGNWTYRDWDQEETDPTKQIIGHDGE